MSKLPLFLYFFQLQSISDPSLNWQYLLSWDLCGFTTSVKTIKTFLLFSLFPLARLQCVISIAIMAASVVDLLVDNYYIVLYIKYEWVVFYLLAQ